MPGRSAAYSIAEAICQEYLALLRNESNGFSRSYFRNRTEAQQQSVRDKVQTTNAHSELDAKIERDLIGGVIIKLAPR